MKLQDILDNDTLIYIVLKPKDIPDKFSVYRKDVVTEDMLKNYHFDSINERDPSIVKFVEV